ncbi:MAG: radical SAM protein [Erysipelotrichaceae bacterium]|nr:radical SAM protein [Erysipelotrichaceae bacterium]
MIQLPVEPRLTKYLYRKASITKTPLSASFELTPLCNMACRMCYVRMDKKTQESIAPLRSCDEWMDIAKQAREHGLLYILLTGGEPFTHPEFREILSGLHKEGFIVSVNTNGTLIDEQTIVWLKETPPVRVNITLYGASNETYFRLCGKPDGFTRVTRAISLLREAGITVKINLSLTPYNADDLEGIFAFCKDRGLLISGTSYMFPPLRRDSTCIGRNARFTPEQAAYYSAKIESLLNGEESFLKRTEEGNYAALAAASDEECSVDCPGEGDIMRCRAGRCTCWVTWEGKMLFCGMIPDNEAPNVFDIGFMNAWKTITEKTEKIRLPAVCRDCDIKDTCKACAAMVYTESGNYHTVPEYRCRMAHAYPGQVVKVVDEIKRRNEEDK